MIVDRSALPLSYFSIDASNAFGIAVKSVALFVADEVDCCALLSTKGGF
jgi:hypothetical protein